MLLSRAPGAGLLIAALALTAMTLRGGQAAHIEDPLPSISLTPKERTEVLAGRVVLREVPGSAGKGKTFEAVGLLPGTLDDAFEVITDYARYPEFMPRMAKLVVAEPREGGCVADCTIEVPLSPKRRYRLLYTASRSEEGFRVNWEKLPWPELEPGETIADTRGYWLVRRLDEGGPVCALYHVYADPGRVPLGLSGLANSLSKGGLRDVLLKTRARIRKLHPASPPDGGARQTP